MRPYFQDGSLTLYHGDSLAVLRTMPDQSVDCCVTSPPYFGLRDYGTDGQYGLEASPAEYVETMRAVFAEVRRVLADDGTFWLNIGDSYSGGNRATYDTNGGKTRARGHSAERPVSGVPGKNLLGIPWRVAFALQDDGWILRNDIVWAKPNAMPESVTDRLSNRHEHLFMLAKSRRYWFDLDPIREEVIYPAGSPALNWARDTKEADVPGQSMRQHRTARTHGKAESAALAPTGKRHAAQDQRGKNPGDVWTVPTAPFPEAHFAVMAPELARRAVVAGCKPGGVVLDPFSGSGTTGHVAGRLGRKYVGIDLSRDYLDLSLRTRLAQAALDFGEPA